jgi:hypothetical protein
MTERADPGQIACDERHRVWSVTEFAARYDLDNAQRKRLLALFGPFATTCELRYNAERKPKYR